jgi:Do/DeqQ family serine protease
MRFVRLSLVVALIGVLLGGGSVVGAAFAEDSAGTTLQDMLKGFLGKDDAKPDTGQGTAKSEADGQVLRRVPFGREEMQLSFAPLVKNTAPAVVNVYASSRVQARSPFMGDPFFEQFFGRQMPPRVQKSLGSGVLVDPSGIIVTNYHVIRDADEVKVALSDGREFESKILFKDQSLDLAVLKIKGKEDFPTVAIGDSDALAVGDLVLAIGNPFGVGQTVTSGIVSAVARSNIGISDFGFFIQTDAAINPGNSGGPLIDMQGRLVGLNTAIYSRSGGSVGIGFAIPSNMVRAVLDAARKGEEFLVRPYIGATFDAVTPQIADALGMDKATGALVSNVMDDGPAKAAGLRPGDVVVELDHKPVEQPEAINYRLATQSVGATVELGILRQGQRETVKVALAEAPKGQSAELSIGGQGPFSGARVADLSPYLAQKLQLPTDEKGVAIVNVDPNSAAASVGLQTSDIVREVNGEKVASAKELKQVAENGSRWWRFTIERDGHMLQQMLRF